MPICTAFRVQGVSLVRAQFVETGFFKGATSLAALDAGFKRVASVELDEGLYRAGLELPPVVDGRIRLFHGSSPDILPRMVDPGLPALVYLDGHLYPEASAAPLVDPVYGECPVLAELQILRDIEWEVPPVIVVDDANMFRRPWDAYTASRFTESHWPTTREVLCLLSDYKVVETDCALYALPYGFGA